MLVNFYHTARRYNPEDSQLELGLMLGKPDDTVAMEY
jgi:hypothetical protein